MRNAINWFEIPATDFERAAAFYDALYAEPLKRDVFMGIHNAFIPKDEGVSGGAVVGEGTPGTTGALVYLNANGQLDAMLERAVAAGGQVALPRTSIGPQGFMAIIIDTEGNRIGLHEAA